MFDLTSCFLLLKIYDILTFCFFVFLDLFKIIFIVYRNFILSEIKFLFSTENENLLFSFFDYFLFLFLRIIFLEIQPNIFLLPFFISIKIKIQNNQTKHLMLC